MKIAFKSLHLSRLTISLFRSFVECDYVRVFFLSLAQYRKHGNVLKKKLLCTFVHNIKGVQKAAVTKAHRKFHIIFSFQLRITAQCVLSNAYERAHVIYSQY